MFTTQYKNNNSNLSSESIRLTDITKQFKGILIGKRGENINKLKSAFSDLCFTNCSIDVGEDTITCKAKSNITVLVDIVNSELTRIMNRCYYRSKKNISVQHQKNLLPNLRRRYRCHIQYDSKTKELIIIGENKDSVIRNLGIKTNKSVIHSKFSGYVENEFPSLGATSAAPQQTVWGKANTSIRKAPKKVEKAEPPKKRVRYEENSSEDEYYSDDDDLHCYEDPNYYT